MENTFENKEEKLHIQTININQKREVKKLYEQARRPSKTINGFLSKRFESI